MNRKNKKPKQVADFFTVISSKERHQILRQAIRKSNQDQKEILDFARKQKSQVFKDSVFDNKST